VEGEVGGEDGEARRRGRYKQDVEREVDRIKVKVSSRCASLQWLKLTIKLAAKVTHLSSSWRSAQIVRTREKVCTSLLSASHSQY